MRIFNRKNKVDELRQIVEQNNKKLNKKIDDLFEKIDSLQLVEQKTDNSLQNDKELQLRINGKGKQNTSGIYRVSYDRINERWKYNLKENGMKYTLSNKSLKELEREKIGIKSIN